MGTTWSQHNMKKEKGTVDSQLNWIGGNKMWQKNYFPSRTKRPNKRHYGAICMVEI